MYRKLKNEVKKKIDSSVLIKIIGLKDYDVFRSFLFKKFDIVYQNTIEGIAFQQLELFNIKQGTLCLTKEIFAISIRNKETGKVGKLPIIKGSLLVPISFKVCKDMEQELVPNIKFWYLVYLNNKIYYMDANEFLLYSGAKYIIEHDLSS